MKNEKTNLKLYTYEQKFWNKNLFICGVDEVGRGCLAGPVVTAAAILNKNSFHPQLIDSKKLTKNQLSTMYQWLINNCKYNIAINSSRVIDVKNIYQATKLTMKQSILHLLATTPYQPSLILVDAMPLMLADTNYKKIPCTSLIKGESQSTSIAAASIIAKVTRDNIMKRLHSSFPCYNLQQHKGYATAYHRSALVKQNFSVLHRHTFLTKILAQ